LSMTLGQGENMEISQETKATVKPALWGAAAGAIALAIVGFNWGGWVTGGTAETLAKNSAATAVVAALAPSVLRSSDKPLMPRRTWPK